MSPKPPRRGALIRGGDRFDQLFEQNRQVTQITAAPPLEALRSPTGYHIRDTTLPGFWVEIGFESVTPIQPYAYSAYRLTVNETTLAVEREPDFFFHADTYPIIEMAENEDVPEGALIYVYPGRSGRYYTGAWNGEMAESGSGSGDDACNDLPGVDISDFLICDDDGASIRDGRLVICNGRLQFIPDP